MEKFKNIEYLKQGNSRQKNVYSLLNNFRILEILKDYHPLIVGTIPIEIDLEDSDVDIILETNNFIQLENYLIEKFGQFEDFSILQQTNNLKNILVGNFMIDRIPFEIYAENKPTYLQNGYLHMIKESEILSKKDERFRQEIISLKKSGIKTEPAFAELLGLKGDPYVELLQCKI